MDTKLATEKNEGGPSTSGTFKTEAGSTTEMEEPQYFQCFSCSFRTPYEYFGRNPSCFKNYLLLEDSYTIEDPFSPPKQGKIIILGAHCIKCRKAVCKDNKCSFYFEGTLCLKCAKQDIKNFPISVREKLNKII
ncbi:cysteine-rich DPF motif domain-containing protein 1 [Diorhabda sublineata]|uniref:cysteine-rich DPF motif domain-containing protein 1 n=1 Tax=Diorhabda sublineata TaxID=1163346 RepID=UPI0024E12F0C|nr:cysteine-rich DPF motif domain-containing protein 1 [Diorhabda sublineata]